MIISDKRIDTLCRRSQYSALARFFITGAVQWEQNEVLPYKAIRTCLYRLNYPTLVYTLDQTIQNALHSTLSVPLAAPDEEELLHALNHHYDLKAVRRCPVTLGGNDEDR